MGGKLDLPEEGIPKCVCVGGAHHRGGPLPGPLFLLMVESREDPYWKIIMFMKKFLWGVAHYCPRVGAR